MPIPDDINKGNRGAKAPTLFYKEQDMKRFFTSSRGGAAGFGFRCGLFVAVFALVFALTGCKQIQGLLGLGDEEESKAEGEDNGGKTWPLAKRESPSIKEKFGVTEEGTAGVANTFHALSAYIKGAEFGTGDNAIALGDYIDLEGGLTVGESGLIANTDLGDYGYLLRLIVVGINSFSQTGGGYQPPAENQGTPHVVFQFQNVPLTRAMNSAASNADGYPASEMRTYLTGAFLTGLYDAGVPPDVLWGPKRAVSGGSDSEGWPAEEITDVLWLPTERELLFGSQYYYSLDSETAGNQARLEYYQDDNMRIKYDYSSAPTWYWAASLSESLFSTLFFCAVTDSGHTNIYSNGAGGCAPAFCVR